MKQAIRLMTHPKIFFNQLQWSKNHLAILFSFLVITIIQTEVGKDLQLYSALIQPLMGQLNLSEEIATWLVTLLRIFLMIASFIGVVESLWLIGTLFTKQDPKHLSIQQNSKRVFYRRTAIVATIFLAGHTAHTLLYVHQGFGLIGILFYVWSMRLGYYAMQEQFHLKMKQLFLLALISLVIFLNSAYLSRTALNYLVSNVIVSTQSTSK